ncbi:MAG: hypothetical protein MUD00_01755 [Candidatus Pacebacteria bacterium]|jgi:hypothetical protein|nr:hypothetical protein [Candidatus Paceibacterota bacterium]
MNNKQILLLQISTFEDVPLFIISFNSNEEKKNTWQAQITPANEYVSSKEFMIQYDETGKQIFQTTDLSTGSVIVIGVLEIIRESVPKNASGSEKAPQSLPVKKMIFTIYSDQYVAKPYGIPIMLMKAAMQTA